VGAHRSCRSLATVALAAVLVAAGCGDDDDGAEPATTTTTTTPATTEGTKPATTTSTTAPPGPTVPAGLGAYAMIVVQGDAVTVEWLLSNGDPSADRTIQVPLNTSMRIDVVADRVEEVHLHGYDLTADLTPGVPGTIDFVADAPGTFEIELEQSHIPLAQLEVS
jgi:hypothetical protein